MVGRAVVDDQEDPLPARRVWLRQAVGEGLLEAVDAAPIAGLAEDTPGPHFEECRVTERPMPLLLKLVTPPPIRCRCRSRVRSGYCLQSRDLIRREHRVVGAQRLPQPEA